MVSLFYSNEMFLRKREKDEGVECSEKAKRSVSVSFY